MRHRLAIAVIVLAASAVPSFAATKEAGATVAHLAPLAAQSFPIPVPHYLAGIIADAAKQYKVDPNLLAAMAFRESRFDPHAVSRIGAQGVMQLMPNTARALGVRDSFDARDNIYGGAKYVKYLLDRFNGNIELTLAAYNAGPELVAKVGPTATQEAVDYVAAVKSFYANALRAL